MTSPSQDPTDLDFTTFLADTAPRAKARPATAAVLEDGAIGEQALKRDGYHVVIARAPRRPARAEGHVLIVEDDDDTATLSARTLERGGYETFRTSSPRETAHVMRTHGIPALILLDVELGSGLDGFDMLARMRAHPRLSDVPVVLFTSRSSREDVVRGLTLGADGYVVKPIAGKTLLEVVARVLGRA